MNVTAHLRNLRISPRKVRLVAELIVGMSVARALRELVSIPKHAAEPVRKLLRSAIANAEHNFQLKQDDLMVVSAVVNQGPTMKRMMPRAMGRGAVIRKRMSHVTIVLAVKNKNEDKTKTKKLKAKS